MMIIVTYQEHDVVGKVKEDEVESCWDNRPLLGKLCMHILNGLQGRLREHLVSRLECYMSLKDFYMTTNSIMPCCLLSYEVSPL